MNLKIFAVLLLMLGTTRCLQYRDIERLGVATCPLKNSCDRMGDAIFDERNCECDSKCGSYGDCCIDAPYNRDTPRGKICLPHDSTSHDGTYAIIMCPRDYAGPTMIRRQCQMNDFRDPLMSTPVTDVSNRKTYLNRYCAMCNGAREADLKTWSISCRLKTQTTWDRIVYREDQHRWGVEEYAEFEPCQFRFDRPPNVTGFRNCWSNTKSACHRNWRNQTVANACKSYTSVVVDSRDRAYKNPHCAVCNGVPVRDITCYSPSVMARKPKPFSFALLLDVNMADGDVVGVTQRCQSGQKYDPYAKRCRRLACAIPGFVIVNGKCVQQ